MKSILKFAVPTAILSLTFVSLGQAWPTNNKNTQSASVPVNQQTSPSATIATGTNTTGDPLKDLESVSKNLNKVVQETMRRMRNYQQAGKAFEPDADFVEFPDKYVVKIDLPGMQKDQINIEASDSALTISGERKTERTIGTPTQEGVYQYERSSGSFYRKMSLPADANVNAIAAKYENGVLEVTIPKLKVSSPESKKVAIQ